MSGPNETARVEAHLLDAARFGHLETLFAAKGCSFARQCWCMDYRVRGRVRPDEGASVAETKRRAMRALADGKPPPGLIGTLGGRPVGWVAVGPREMFARLERSPVMKPVDAEPVWSVVCFVTAGEARGRGVARQMLEHAVVHAKSSGARILEGYPLDKEERSAPQFIWHGPLSMFLEAGFVEVARRKPTRPVVRLALDGG